MLARNPPGRRRRGATMVEAALVLPITFFLIFAIVIGGVGVFRYQQVAALAREGARYASTHGGDFRRDAGLPVGNAQAWRQDVYTNGILPFAGGLDADQLMFNATWSTGDNFPVRVISSNGATVGNVVTVTVTYQWIPPILTDGVTLTSTSVMPMSY